MILKRSFIPVLILLLSAFLTLPFFAAGATYYISPSGNDSADGLTTGAALKTIQKAVEAAQPGDTVNLAAGEYRQDIISRRNGSLPAPITITGPAEAVIKGGGNDRVIEINHDYYILNGFTVDGLYGPATKASNYRDILVFVHGKETRDGVTGFKATNLTLQNARGECLRLRYFITRSEISYNTIKNCGVGDFVFTDGGKNGEGIYLGTSSKQWGDGKNPTSDPDATRDNHIHHNTIDTQGNECVDIKEGATANLVEYNTCRGQKDPESGGFDSRGDGNTFRYNSIKDNVGAGIRLGGWLVKNIQYGKNNDVYENIIENNKGGGIRFQVTPQGKICGNQFLNNLGGNSVGIYASKFDPAKACAGGATTTEEKITPPPAPSQTPPETPPADNQSTGGGSGGGSSSNQRTLTLREQLEIRLTELKKQLLALRKTEKCAFPRYLSIGLTGEDVRCLQRFLNSNGFLVAPTGPGSPGNETLYFGPFTKQAVSAWQTAKASAVLIPSGLTVGTGYWGPASISYYKNNLPLR